MYSCLGWVDASAKCKKRRTDGECSNHPPAHFYTFPPPSLLSFTHYPSWVWILNVHLAGEEWITATLTHGLPLCILGCMILAFTYSPLSPIACSFGMWQPCFVSYVLCVLEQRSQSRSCLLKFCSTTCLFEKFVWFKEILLYKFNFLVDCKIELWGWGLW